MANCGPDTNSSQFYITLASCAHLDGKHVVFGRVVFGAEVCSILENTRTDNDDKPYAEVRISHCGELEFVTAGGAAATEGFFVHLRLSGCN